MFPVLSTLIVAASGTCDVWGKQDDFPNRKFLKFSFWLDTGKYLWEDWDGEWVNHLSTNCQASNPAYLLFGDSSAMA